MNRLVLCLLVLTTASLAGCGAMEFTEPDDTFNTQERARTTRATPGPTELPPGLGEDLPPRDPPATTAPKASK
jgi:hypothetical protein